MLELKSELEEKLSEHPPHRRVRLLPEERYEQLIQAAILLSVTPRESRRGYNCGYSTVGHADIAKYLNCSTATVFNYENSSANLHQSILSRCHKDLDNNLRPNKPDPFRLVHKECLSVVQQAMALQDPRCFHMRENIAHTHNLTHSELARLILNKLFN